MTAPASEMFVEMDARKDRPAYVRFERRAETDREATKRDGVHRSKNVDYAMITPPFSKDVIHEKVSEWFPKMKQQVERGRLKPEWLKMYEERYKAWQAGQELPVHGTPIRGWPVISPAQQENLIVLNCLTVEDLAAMNEDGMRRVGMGATELKRKAESWLKQATDKGPLTMELARVQSENDLLKANQETMQRQIAELAGQLKALQFSGMVPMQPQPQQHSAPAFLPHNEPAISSADLGLDEQSPQSQTI